MNPAVVEKQVAGIHERSNLTRLQLLYWMSHKLRSGSPLYNTILTFTISGKVDREHFERAFRALLEHHDVLRTVIREADGVPQRQVISNFPYTIQYLDFSCESDSNAAFEVWIHRQARVPLNIEERLFDSALIRLSDDHFVWYLNQHHIITDAASAFLIYERLAKFYQLSREGKALNLPGLPSFEDYAEYERDYRSSPQALRAEAYWERKLNPGPEPMSYYGRVPVKKGTQVVRVDCDLGLERSKKLRAIAKGKDIFTVSEDLTLNNIFAALFFIQLHIFGGNRRLGFVTPVHNRFSEALKNTAGLLMEICPYQVEVSEDETFISLINKVKRETRETLSYYQYGSGLSLQKEGFDVMFNTHHMPVLDLDGASVQVKRIHPGHGSESLALHVNDFASSESFVLNFYFHRDVFSEAQREQTTQSYVRLVDALLEDDTFQISKTISPLVEKQNRLAAANELNHSTGHDQSGTGLPQDMLESQLIRIWEEILDVRPIGVSDNFFDLGGNSWLAVRLFVQIEKLTGQYLPLTTLINTATVSELANCIRQEMGKTLWSSLVTIQPGGDKIPLYMVPGAGGNGLAVSRIAQHLGEDQPVYMFQIPLGEGDEGPPFTSIEDMAAHYVKALRMVQAEGPYFLGGYSAGGLVAFEVAQQLQRQGQKVDFLAIIDVAAQSATFKYMRKFTRGLSALTGMGADRELDFYIYLRDRLFRLTYFLRLGYRDSIQRKFSLGQFYFSRLKRFLQLDNQEKSYRVQRKFSTASGRTSIRLLNPQSQPNAVEEGDMAWQSEDRYMRKYFEINNVAVKCYVPDRYSGRITLFRSREGYQYAEQRSADPQLGWGRIASGELNMYVVPGNHMQIVREPSVKVLGEQLRVCLDQARANGHRAS